MATYRVTRPIYQGADRRLEVGQEIELESDTGVFRGRVELVVSTPKREPELEVATPKRRGRPKREDSEEE